MTPENVQTAAPEPVGMGAFSRLIGVFFEPKKTFEDIAGRPTFLLPLIVMIIFGVAASAVIAQRIDFGKVIRDKMESNSRVQQMPAEQREQQIQMWTKMAPIIGYVGGVVGPIFRSLVVAAVLMLVAVAMMSAPVKFKQMFSLTCYAWVPSIFYFVLLTVVVYLKPPDEFNVDNPLAFNPAAFLDPTTTSKFVYSLATAFDLFSFWYIFLLATGIKAAAGKKYAFGSALFAVLAPWCLLVLGQACWASVFG